MELTLANAKARMMLTGVRQAFAYAEGQKGAAQGWTYSVVLTTGEALSVKHTSAVAPIATTDAITAAMETGEPLWVQCSGVLVKPYVKDNRVAYSAACDSIEQVF